MTDIILHLWRYSKRQFANNLFTMSNVGNLIRDRSDLFARSLGTAETFFLRVQDNDSSTDFSLTFQVNGIVKATIGPILVGQTGKFLPGNQLPISFAKDDLLVIQLTGFTQALFSNMEWGIDLKFTTSP